MRLQFLMLGIATVIALAVGAGKWRARMTAAIDFEHDERRGGWVFVLPDTTGVAVWSKGGGRDPIDPYRNVYIADGGLGATKDLRRIAYVDNAKWDAPAIAVRTATIRERPIASAASPQGYVLSCPRFDADGSLLYLEQSPWQPAASYNAPSRPPTKLMRLALPDADVEMQGNAGTVALAAPIVTDDCFDLSDDGDVLAWVGTDYHVHVAKRSGNGFAADHKTFAGNDAELSPDGAWLAMMDAQKVVKIDVASGSKSTIATTKGGMRVGAISPDGSWVLVQQSTGFGYGWTAYRVKDGAPVSVPVPDRMAYYVPERDKLWIAREGKLPDPTPIPTRTPRPRATPRRR